MKRKKLLNALSSVDDKYIKEADPSNRRISTRVWAGILAASLCLVTVLNLWLFLPFGNKEPDVSRYKDSEYFSVIKKINTYTHKRKSTVYKNNFNKLSSYFDDVLGGAMDGGNSAAGDAAGGFGSGGAEKYEEVTDNQTDGVIEGDRIKRSDTHIYYLSGNILSVYTIAGEESEKVGSFDLSTLPLLFGGMLYLDEWELFLSSDCKTVTVIAPFFSYEKQSATVALISLNVENPDAITAKSTFAVSGSYLSSRKTENELLLFTRFHMANEVDFDKKETYLPTIDSGSGAEFLPADQIFSPDELSALSYTVVLKLDENALSLGGVAAFLSYSDEVYVSNEHVFALRSFSETKTEGKIRTTTAKTEISCLAFSDGFTHKGSFTVNGRITDRYSLDEYDGILRVFTTLSESRFTVNEDGDDTSLSFDALGSGTNAALYLVSLDDFSVVNKVERFAPDGETVKSARFDGTAAYVCTSVEMKDPVFFFDLSDVKNITYKETGTIEGFSTSLVDFGSGTLLGIGVGGWDSVKLEVYRESENGVIAIDAYEVKDADYSTKYKAYYIDRENRLVGLGIRDYKTNESYYVVLLFDGYALREVLNAPLTGDNDLKRGMYIDGCFYMFGENGYLVERLVP